MRDFLFKLQFARPSFLLLFLLFPLLWLRLRGRAIWVILWRSLSLLLMVLALADPQIIGEVTKKGERIFAFDLSRSIPGGMRRWMLEQNLVPQAGDRALIFAGEVEEATDWDYWLRGEVPASRIKPEQTNLENLFSTLMRSPSGPRIVFLLTDGWESQGSLERLLPSLVLSGMKVFPLLPPAPPEVANVAIKKIVAPHQGTSGEGISLKVVVENQNAGEVDGILTLRLNGQPFKSEPLKIKPGSQIFTYQAALPDRPRTSFQAQFVPRKADSDLFTEDNQATTWISVRTKEKILLLNGRSGEGRYLEEILKRRGYEVTSLTPTSTAPSPAGYGIIIFNNVEREKFSSAYLEAIERHVADGNAFLMLGGEGSFAPGGYRQTPIERVLPVELKEPKREEKNRALVLVIDKSGSMREENRLLYAKEAAKAVVDQLGEGDLLGVLGFDIEPFVVVSLSPVERIRGTVAAEIDRLKAQGRTYLYPAIVEAKRQLEAQRAGRKHVIILSDGETGGSGSDYIDLVTVMKEELKITTSTVAIGDQANIPLLKRIAQYGGGFFHHTYDPRTLPQIVLQQIREEPERGAPVERDFTPVPVKGSELLAGFPERSYPFLKGYIETEIKRGASPDLIIPREERKAPLLASWNYGKGKAVAFTTDLHGRWTKQWIQWGALERFWDKVFDWLRPVKELLPPHEVRINLLGDQTVLDLYLYEERGNGRLFRYSLTGKGVSGQGLLKRLAPGHYQAVLPVSAPGDYDIALTEERPGGKLAYPPLGYTLPFNPRSELPKADFNLSLLEQIAQSTGGKINPNPQGEEIRRDEVIRSSKPLRFYLIFLALILVLSEIIFRRFFQQL